MDESASNPLLFPGLEQDYRIRPNEADSFNELKVPAALDLLQDMAWEHAHQLGVSVTQLMERNQTWVLSRFHLVFDQPITQGETVTLRTWPVKVYRLFAIRDFEILSPSGTILARATSGWLLLSWPELRPLRPEDIMKEIQLYPQRSVEDDFEALPRPNESVVESPFQVRWHDLDINNHVNNTVYPLWALESFPESFHRNHRCRSLEIQFTGMAFPGDRILSRRSDRHAQDNPCAVHQIVNAESGKELARLRTHWEKRPINPGVEP